MSASLHILIAEDDEFLSALLQAQCSSMGFNSTAVANGELAVSEALSYQYDVLLLDIQMPVCDGIAAMTILRQLGYERPIIAVSSDEVQAEGFDKVLLKPLDLKQLSQFLQQLDVAPVLELGLSEELIQLFYQTLAQDTTAAIDAMQQADWQSMARIAHKVKGGAASFGELQLSSLANELMQLLKSPATAETKQQACQHFVLILQQVGSQAHG